MALHDKFLLLCLTWNSGDGRGRRRRGLPGKRCRSDAWHVSVWCSVAGAAASQQAARRKWPLQRLRRALISLQWQVAVLQTLTGRRGCIAGRTRTHQSVKQHITRKCTLGKSHYMRCHCIAGVYRPPRLTATAMEDDPDRRRSAKERRREREASRRGGRSALVRLYCRHMSDDPACAPSIGHNVVRLPAFGPCMWLPPCL